LSGTKGVVWQYTAIDVHSGFCWAELHTSEKNPRERDDRDVLDGREPDEAASALGVAGVVVSPRW
jgi:hypothetical protein